MTVYKSGYKNKCDLYMIPTILKIKDLAKTQVFESVQRCG